MKETRQHQTWPVGPRRATLWFGVQGTVVSARSKRIALPFEEGNYIAALEAYADVIEKSGNRDRGHYDDDFGGLWTVAGRRCPRKSGEESRQHIRSTAQRDHQPGSSQRPGGGPGGTCCTVHDRSARQQKLSTN